ncbi:uncharacterized protein BDCG_17365 [Blastomyces dermatitidis ER-3]|uniref:Uncharacterized protein n=1 Tax=Ajellomyces dermatitidis (strain ER-3 / ATCC MYA-2586) TaxID=559297 RepID=A0ABX2VY50_AJEDR|nr:uncharacterized protein BDCG_17365 [Blastomyces dermatitidis ER-3]OAT02070.1 hypothetical protein BDCG_17365 [Blastomyces dermatitidis ER-3]
MAVGAVRGSSMGYFWPALARRCWETRSDEHGYKTSQRISI